MTRGQKYYRANKEKYKARTKKWISENREHYCIYQLWNNARNRAKRKELEFTITREDIQIPTHCPVLGIPIIIGEGKPTDNSPSIDRIDNRKGYIKDNICVISYRANRIKNDASIEEFHKVYLYMTGRLEELTKDQVVEYENGGSGAGVEAPF